MSRLLLKNRLLFLFIVLIICSYADAAEMTAQNNEEKPIVITSQRMTALNEQNKLVFEKDVVAKKDDMTLYADKMEILFTNIYESCVVGEEKESGGEEKKDIAAIKATGNVKVVKGEKTATADEAIYYKDEEKVVLKGNPKAWEKDDMVTGTKMTIFIKEDKSIVEGSKVVVNPQKKDKKKGFSIFK